MASIDPNRLFSALLNTGLQTKDNPTYQVIYYLIDSIRELNKKLASIPSGSGGGTTVVSGIGPPGLDGSDGEPGDLGPPGAQGIQGITGSQGPPGQGVYFVEDGIDGNDGFNIPVPGAAGGQGNTGDTGATGPAVTFIEDSYIEDHVLSNPSPASSATPDLFVRKTSDESKTSDAAVADDAELILTLAGNSVYEIRLSIFYSAGTTGDISIRLSGPADIVGAMTGLRLSNSATATEGNLRASSAPNFVAGVGTPTLSAGGAGAGVALCMTLTAIVITTTGGALAFQWAQSVSNGTATVVATNSFMVANKLA